MKPPSHGIAVLLSMWLAHAADAAAPPVVSVAHRGGIVPGVPENTLAAYRRAIEHGAQAIEIDLRTTQDGQIVIMHDETVDRTTNGHGKVAQLTWAELQQLDAGSGERIPTYEQALQLVAGTDVALLLDIKVTHNLDRSKVVQLAAKHNALRNVIVGARRLSDLRAFRKLNPGLRTLGFMKELDDLDAFVRAGADIIRLWPDWIEEHPELIAKVHGLGKPVWIIAGDAGSDKLAAFMRLGVDGILSDFPERMHAVLEDRVRGHE
jgi:glycerophosphoryl diester phosphodiesterase